MTRTRIAASLLAALLSIAFGGAGASSAQGQPPAHTVTPIKCPFEIPNGYDITCASVSAPEDHRRPGGGTIALAVAVVHRRGVVPVPDPVLYIDGGPGAHTLRIVPALVTFLAPILETRDVIFFDQRGVGFSQPALDCPEVTAQSLADRAQGVSEREGLARSIDALVACRDRLAAAGIHLSAYTTAQSAADVRALRVALGYEMWNLYGVSYGTRVALAVLRDHPEGIRSVVLDSPAPPNAAAITDRATSIEAALQILFDHCAADPICRMAYPDLQSTYERLIDDLNAAPASVEAKNPLADEIITLKIDGALFGDVVVGLLGNRESIAQAPALIQNVADGDYSFLARTLSPMLTGMAVANRSIGQSYAVVCAGEVPFLASDEARAVATSDPRSADSVEAVYAACEAWGIGQPDPIANQAVRSDVPALLLSGEYDAGTPPAYARLAAETLPNSVLYELPAVGHSVVLNSTCAAKIVRSFLDRPTAPDASCIAEMRPPRFLITIAPPRLLAGGIAIASGLVTVACTAAFASGLMRLQRRKQIAWRAALRHTGWLPLALSSTGIGFFTALFLFGEEPQNVASAVEASIPIAIAIQAALLFSPGDEPALEVLLVAPRPVRWVVLERYVTVFVLQAVVGAAGTAAAMILSNDTNVWLAIVRWLPAAIGMSGLTLFIAIRSRQAALGIVIAIMVWFIMLIGRDTLLPVELGGRPFPAPLDLIQPALWLVHVHLNPDRVSAIGYIINRIVITGMGCLLIAWALHRLSDAEWVLLGMEAKRQPRRITNT